MRSSFYKQHITIDYAQKPVTFSKSEANLSEVPICMMYFEITQIIIRNDAIKSAKSRAKSIENL